MKVKQKLPWTRPVLRKIELTQEIIDLLACRTSESYSTDVTPSEAITKTNGDRALIS